MQANGDGQNLPLTTATGKPAYWSDGAAVIRAGYVGNSSCSWCLEAARFPSPNLLYSVIWEVVPGSTT